MIVSIGERCLLQNWIYFKCKNEGISYKGETIISRSTPYPVNTKTPIAINKLLRYDDFCGSFIGSGQVVDTEIDGRWFASAKEGFRIHWSSGMDLQKMAQNLRNCDVMLYWHIDNTQDVKNVAFTLMEGISKINPSSKLIIFSEFIQQDFIGSGFTIIKLLDDIRWINPYEREQFRGMIDYIPFWGISQANQDVFERVWEQIKCYA